MIDFIIAPLKTARNAPVTYNTPVKINLQYVYYYYYHYYYYILLLGRCASFQRRCLVTGEFSIRPKSPWITCHNSLTLLKQIAYSPERVKDRENEKYPSVWRERRVRRLVLLSLPKRHRSLLFVWILVHFLSTFVSVSLFLLRLKMYLSLYLSLFLFVNRANTRQKWGHLSPNWWWLAVLNFSLV